MTRPQDAATEALAEALLTQEFRRDEPSFRFEQTTDDADQCVRLKVSSVYVIRKARKSG